MRALVLCDVAPIFMGATDFVTCIYGSSDDGRNNGNGRICNRTRQRLKTETESNTYLFTLSVRRCHIL